MSREQHRAEAGDTPLEVHVLVISSSRTTKTDASGALIAELVSAAGHRVADRSVVDDDVNAIRAAVRSKVERGAQVLILTGGTGVTGRDVTPEALHPLLRPRLDGFGELFRMLSYAEIGAAAMLSRAVAGLCGGAAVFAIPGSQAACRLAVEKLILPDLRHLVSLAHKERQATAPEPSAEVIDVAFDDVPEPGPTSSNRAAEPQGESRSADTRPGARVGLTAEPDAAPPPPEGEAPWQALIRSWGGSVALEAREPLPEPIERLAPVLHVLQQAGRSAALVLGDGRRFSLWGFPDLVRPSSKVLAVREGEDEDLGEVLALHRWPVETGTVVPGGVLGAHLADPLGTAERVTGRRPPAPLGPLFAIAAGSTWHRVEGKVVRWDGHRIREEGTPKQVLASLVLDWSAR